MPHRLKPAFERFILSKGQCTLGMYTLAKQCGIDFRVKPAQSKNNEAWQESCALCVAHE